MIILDLVHNIALLVALAVACQVIEARWHMRRLTSQLLYGLLFGAVGVAGMMTPVPFLPGIIFDGRSIILSVGGFWGGPVVALISAIPCAAYRLWLGGAGAAMGVSVIAESAALGAAFYHWRRRRARPLRLRELWGFGLLVHGVMLVLTFLLPGGASQTVQRQLGFAILGIYPVATMLICRLFLDYEKQRQDQTALEESEARHRVTLMSVGDAVITTDTQGRVELLNPVAEALTGWTQQDARGKTLEEVFHIVDEETRRPTESPVRRVIRDGTVVGLANHTALIARNGTEHPIADSGAPIRDEQNEIIGVVLVFRDQSEERAAQKALQTSEAMFRAFMDNLPGYAYIRDTQHRHVFVNRRFEDKAGLAAQDILGKNNADVFDAEAAKRLDATDDLVLQTGMVADVEETVVERGVLRHFDSHNFPVTGLDSPLVGGISIDITKRKQAEEGLRERDRYIRTVLENAPIGFAVNTIHDGKALFVSGRFEDIYGVPRGSLRSVEEYFEKVYQDAAFREQIRARIMGDLAAGDASRMHWEDIPILSADGRQRYVTAANIPVPDQDLMVSTVQDVTARHLAEAALREKTRLTNVLLDAMPCVALLVRPQTREIVTSNKAAAEYGAVPGTRCFETWGRSQAPCSRCMASDLWSTGQPQHMEVQMDGVIWDMHWFPVSEDLYLHYAFDITQLRHAEQQVKAREAELMHVSRLSTLGEMASGFAHELNQPLTAILTFANATQRSVQSQNADEERLMKNLDQVIAQTKRAGEIIRRIRAFAQRRQPRLSPIDLNGVVQEVLGLFGSDARYRGVEVVLDLSEHLPPVLADAIQVQQVLVNLIRNAFEAMDAIEMQRRRLTLRTSIDPHDKVRISVSDTGPGIPPEAESKVFDPFFTTKKNGLGIGLSISRSIVESHRGHFSIQSGPTQGCTVSFTLPTARPDAVYDPVGSGA